MKRGCRGRQLQAAPSRSSAAPMVPSAPSEQRAPGAGAEHPPRRCGSSRSVSHIANTAVPGRAALGGALQDPGLQPGLLPHSSAGPGAAAGREWHRAVLEPKFSQRRTSLGNCFVLLRQTVLHGRCPPARFRWVKLMTSVKFRSLKHKISAFQPLKIINCFFSLPECGICCMFEGSFGGILGLDFFFGIFFNRCFISEFFL